MSTINQLNSIATVSGSDLLATWSASDSASRKVSLYNLLAWINSQDVVAQDGKITQYSAPLAGDTVQINESGSSVWLILTPAGTLATLTLKLPLVTGVLDKTELLVNCTQIITALTLDANGASIVGGPTALAAVNGFFRLRFDDVMDTWYRVG